MFVTDKNLPSLKCLRTRARPLKRTLHTCSTHTHSHTHYTQIPSNSHKGSDFTRCCFFISVLYCTTLKHEKIPVVKERQQTTIMYIIYIFCLFNTLMLLLFFFILCEKRLNSIRESNNCHSLLSDLPVVCILARDGQPTRQLLKIWFNLPY